MKWNDNQPLDPTKESPPPQQRAASEGASVGDLRPAEDNMAKSIDTSNHLRALRWALLLIAFGGCFTLSAEYGGAGLLWACPAAIALHMARTAWAASPILRMVIPMLLCFSTVAQAQTAAEHEQVQDFARYYLDKAEEGNSGFRAEIVSPTLVQVKVWLEVHMDGETMIFGGPGTATSVPKWLVCDALVKTPGTPVDEIPGDLATTVTSCLVQDTEPPGDTMTELMAADVANYFKGGPDDLEPSCGWDAAEGGGVFGSSSDCYADCSWMRAHGWGTAAAALIGGGSAVFTTTTAAGATAATAIGGGSFWGGIGLAITTGASVVITPFAIGATVIVAAGAAGGGLYWIHNGSGCPGCGTEFGFINWMVSQDVCYNFQQCYCGQNAGRLLGYGANSDAACCATYSVDRNGVQAGCLDPAERPDDDDPDNDPNNTSNYTGCGPTQTVTPPASGTEGMGSEGFVGDECEDNSDCSCSNDCWGSTCASGGGFKACVDVCLGFNCTGGCDSPPQDVTCGEGEAILL